jgi:multidrug efflux pump subunit AcrB
VFVRDVARIEDATVRAALARIDGQRAVWLPLFSAGAAAPTAEEIRKVVARLETGLPDGTRLAFLPCGVDAGAAELTVYLRAPSGSSLTATERHVAAVERFLEGAIPAGEREWIISDVGVRADPSALYTPNAGSQDATVRVRLGEKRAQTAAVYAVKLREQFGKEKAFADLSARFRAGAFGVEALGAVPADLAVRVRGGDDKARAETAARVSQRVGRVPGVLSAQVRQRRDAPCLVLGVDRAKVAALGLSAVDVFQQVADAGGAPRAPARVWVDPRTGASYRLVVRPAEQHGAPAEQLRDVPLNVTGKVVPLSNVTDIKKLTGPVELDRADGLPVLDILIDLGAKRAEAATEVEKVMRDEKPPAGVTLELRRFSPDANR